MAVGVKAPEQEAAPEPAKLTRDVFLYQDPKPPADEFAQCSTCCQWTGPQKQRCLVLGSRLKVDDDDSCNVYCHGAPRPDLVAKDPPCFSPEEVGFVDREVRCENCRAFDGLNRCLLYQALNDCFPEKFDLEERVNPKGCCTANKTKEKGRQKTSRTPPAPIGHRISIAIGIKRSP